MICKFCREPKSMCYLRTGNLLSFICECCAAEFIVAGYVDAEDVAVIKRKN